MTPPRLVGRRVELVTIGSFSVPGPRGGEGEGEENGGSSGGGVVTPEGAVDTLDGGCWLSGDGGGGGRGVPDVSRSALLVGELRPPVFIGERRCIFGRSCTGNVELFGDVVIEKPVREVGDGRSSAGNSVGIGDDICDFSDRRLRVENLRSSCWNTPSDLSPPPPPP